MKAYARAWNKHVETTLPIPEAIERAIDPRVAAIIRQTYPLPLSECIPPELRNVTYNIIMEGPYAKYRWREKKQTYTISLGLLNDYPEYPFIPKGF